MNLSKDSLIIFGFLDSAGNLIKLFQQIIISNLYKGKTDLAIGNVVGSNIFNVFLVLGATSSIHSIPYDTLMDSDLYVAILSVIILILFVGIHKKHQLTKIHGIVFILLYFLYMGYIIVRG